MSCNFKSLCCLFLVLFLVLSMAACGSPDTFATESSSTPTTALTSEPTSEPTTEPTTVPTVSEPLFAGVVYLTVNPSFAVYFDSNGDVVAIQPMNVDASSILDDFSGYEGVDCAIVLMNLVKSLGHAGYLNDAGVEISIVIEKAEGTKLDDIMVTRLSAAVIKSVNNALSQGNWNVTLTVEQPFVEPTDPPTEPTTEPTEDNFWDGKSYANPKTGISWDGVSPILYYYQDGSTGYEPRDGAKYERCPGIWAVYNSSVENDGRCVECDRLIGDGSNGTCLRNLTMDWTCKLCGAFVHSKECHSCLED